MFFTAQKRHQWENMNHSNKLPEFEKEFDRLLKKYRSLSEDLKSFEKVIFNMPTGFGKNFTIMRSDENLKIVKARLMCKSLRNRDIRIIYAYHQNTLTFMYIEMYFKGDKENEDRERIKRYLKNMDIEN